MGGFICIRLGGPGGGGGAGLVCECESEINGKRKGEKGGGENRDHGRGNVGEEVTKKEKSVHIM